MKAITVERNKLGTARLQEVPEPDINEGSVLVIQSEKTNHGGDDNSYCEDTALHELTDTQWATWLRWI